MSQSLHLFIEDSLMYAEEFFADFGQITRFSGYQLSADDLVDADILLTRSTTQVTADLLSKANKLKFVGTATAGYDHIDAAYLETKQIHWTAAPGCNADAVADYVISSMLNLAAKYQFKLTDKKIAIVGVGQVGSRLQTRLSAIGCELILFDPPKQDQDENFSSASFEAVLNADIISCHVPYTKGEHATVKMFDQDAFAQLKPNCIFINACRGEIVDEACLKAFLQNNPNSKAVLDVFDNEPNIDLSLLPLVEYASPHIAGHSIEGKARGTEILYQKLCEFLVQDSPLTLAQFLPEMDVDYIKLENSPELTEWTLRKIVNLVYDIRDDNYWFRQHITTDPASFKMLRKNYPVRREMTSLHMQSQHKPIQQKLVDLSFNVK